jgi:hypothetical protein
MVTREVGAMYFLLNITLIYPIFSLKKTIFLYNFGKSGLTPYSDCIFFKTFLTVSKSKAANCRVSDYYLTPTQQFSAISWREQVNF